MSLVEQQSAIASIAATLRLESIPKRYAIKPATCGVAIGVLEMMVVPKAIL